jgi:hypothetical protein
MAQKLHSYIFLACVAPVALAACSFAPTTAASGTSASKCSEGAAAIEVDTTQSDAAIAPYQVAKPLLRQGLSEFIAGPHCELAVIVRRLSNDSLSSQDAILSGDIGPVAVAPPKPQKGPFETPAQYKHQLRLWHVALSAIANQQKDAGAAVKGIDATLAHDHPAINDNGSDISGAFVEAQSLVAPFPGAKTIVVLSDLLPSGSQTSDPLNLHHIRVIVITFCPQNEKPQGCMSRDRARRKSLRAAGAQSVQVVDSTEANLLVNLFEG